jgi:hypothetical protein
MSRLLAPASRSDNRVRYLELFLDLAFVLAISETTELVIEEDPTFGSLAAGLLMLVLLWRCWTGFAWLTSALDPRDPITRLAMFSALGVFLVMATSIAGAFHGGLGLLFAAAYAVIRTILVGLGWLASHGDAQFRVTTTRNAVGGVIAVALLVVGALTHGPAQYALWGLAAVADFLIPGRSGAIGWNLSPRHFAERHALIVTIALGESVLAIGIGAKAAGITPVTVAMTLVGICLVVCMWTAYFDGAAEAGEERLASLPPGPVQNRMARYAYSGTHLLIFAADILISLGVYSVLRSPTDPLSAVISAATFVGLAVYLLALVLFRWQATGMVNRGRIAVAFLMVLLAPVAMVIPDWIALMLATALMAVGAYATPRGGAVADASPE